MATPAQCFYCFECLSASFEGREPAKLEVVEGLWEQYAQIKKLAAIKDKGESVSLREDDDERSQQITDDNGAKDYQDGEKDGNRPQSLKLPSVSRLQSQLSSESSSAATTPSLNSNNSSNSISSNSTAVTTPDLQSPPSEAPEPKYQKQKDRRYPLFVTWDTLKNGRKSLRGCIGTFEAQELSEGLKSYTLIS